jgi:hypothetical protein
MQKSLPEILHFLAKEVDGEWLVSCLDFDLAAQYPTLDEAQKALLHQIEDYILDVHELADIEQVNALLSRKSPPRLWAIFYGVWLRQGIYNFLASHSQRLAFVLQRIKYLSIEVPSSILSTLSNSNHLHA